jgi:hypothetical protein
MKEFFSLFHFQTSSLTIDLKTLSNFKLNRATNIDWDKETEGKTKLEKSAFSMAYCIRLKINVLNGFCFEGNTFL